MADMGWTARVAAAAAASAGTGAAQLGLGYGLGVVVWPLSDTPDDSVWLGSLGWATWITASATVLGAVIASRLGGGPKPRSGAALRLSGPWRLSLAAAAAIGALVAVALIALPARSAVRGDTFSPQVIAAGYAMLGVLLGLVVAYWAVVSRPVAANLITTGLWLWALAISAVVVDLTVHRSSVTYLTSWQFAGGTGHLYGTIFWPSAALTLAAAFVIGVISVAPAARRGHFGLGAATSGAVGPLLVAAAFFVLAPQLTGALGPLESAYLIAPYAVIAGLAGSALTVSLTQAVHTRRATRTGPDRRALPAAPTPADSDRDEARTFANQAPPRTRPGRQRTPEPSSDDQSPTDRQRGWRRGRRIPETPAPAVDESAPAREGRWGRRKQVPTRQGRSGTAQQAADPQAATAHQGRSDTTQQAADERAAAGQSRPGQAPQNPGRQAVTGEGRWRKGDRAAEAPALADDRPPSGRSSGWRRGKKNPEAPASDVDRASAIDVATVPAADPATFPAAPAKQKTKLSRLFSRTKVPAQPTADAAPDVSDTAPESDSTASSKPSPARAKSPTEASTRSGAAPKPSTGSSSGSSSGSRPSPRPSAGASTPSGPSPTGQPTSSAGVPSTPPTPPPTPTTGRPSTPPTPITGRAQTPPMPTPTNSRPSTPPTPTTGRPPTPSTATAGRPPTPSKSTAGGSAPMPGKPSTDASGAPRQTGPGRGENVGNRPSSGKSSERDRADGEASDGADPEIAAAARPRGRAKKAAEPVRRAPESDKGPQSTVTPPPSSPTVAQINPKPPAD